jgi:hypothetical protein
MRVLVALVMVVLAAAAAWLLWPRRSTGDDLSDRQAQTIAQAVSQPPQADAMGYARAVLATHSAVVLEATDLKAARNTDPRAHLVIRLMYNTYASGDFNHSHPIPKPVCYGFDLTFFQPVDGPEVVDCPSTAPITPPPRNDIPAGDADALRSVLGALPASPTDAQVKDALAKGLAHTAAPPTVTSAVRGGDVAVSIRGGDYFSGYECTLGLRQGGQVLVWGLPAKATRPGETLCDPNAAFARTGAP